MKHQLKITDEAADLLRSTARWYEKTSQSLEIATAWYDGFLRQLESLEQNPHLGGLALENDKFDFELRELVLRKRQATHAPRSLPHRGQHRRGAVDPAPRPATHRPE